VIGMNHDGGDHRAAHGGSICCLYSRMAERGYDDGKGKWQVLYTGYHGLSVIV
jgi:hypothetical protein